MMRGEGVQGSDDPKDSGAEGSMGFEEGHRHSNNNKAAPPGKPPSPPPSGRESVVMKAAVALASRAAPSLPPFVNGAGAPPAPRPSLAAPGWNAGGGGGGAMRVGGGEFQGAATAATSGSERKRRKPSGTTAVGGGGGSASEDGEGSRVKWMRHKTRALLKDPAGNPELAKGLPRRLADSPLDWATAEGTLQRWAAARGFRTAVFRTSDPQHKQLACTKAGKHREDNRTRNKRPHPDSAGGGGDATQQQQPQAPVAVAPGAAQQPPVVVVTQKCDCPWMIKCVSVSEPIEGVVSLPGIYIVKYPDADHNHDLLPPAASSLANTTSHHPHAALSPRALLSYSQPPPPQRQALTTTVKPRALSGAGPALAGSASGSSPVPLSSSSSPLLRGPASSSSSPRPVTTAVRPGPPSPGPLSPTPPHAVGGGHSSSSSKVGGGGGLEALVRPPPPPHRISFMTFNVWKDDTGQPANWPARRAAFMDTLIRLNPDVLCIQEAHPELLDHILAALPYHHHVVRREEETRGWELESNIFWRSTLFQEVEHGTEALGYAALYPYRHLFWVKLRPRPQPGEEEEGGRTFLVATAHYPWRGNPTELQTGENLRIGAAKRTAAHLRRFAQQDPSMPIFFMGDLNESFHPIRILREGGLLEDCFTALGLPITPTHPIRPAAPQEDALPDECLDWIVASPHARPVLAAVMRPAAVSVPPSDHCPVMAVYELHLLLHHNNNHNSATRPHLQATQQQQQQHRPPPPSSELPAVAEDEEDEEDEVGYGASGLLHLLGPSSSMRRRSHEAPY